jgi:chitinase
MAISPNDYRVVPFDQTAVPFMYPFTALASTSLATYMAVGGGSMSAQVWSAMVSSQANRAAFIGSMKQWLYEFRFDGVDLDWEFPSSAADKANFVALVREMKASFNANYPYQKWGISVVLFVPHTHTTLSMAPSTNKSSTTDHQTSIP